MLEGGGRLETRTRYERQETGVGKTRDKRREAGDGRCGKG